MKTNPIKLIVLLLGLPVAAFANPYGMTVQSGTASAVANGNQLSITASHNAFLNWQSFNIAAGQTTTFIQPSASSVVWNRINDANPSQIFGNLTANGVVVLMNQNGFYFGPNSFVSAAGLIISTAPIGPIDSSAGLFWQFTGPAPTASIINYGQLNVGKGGSAFLIAERIENHGSITAPEGSIGLIAGQEVLLSERPDGRGLSATVKLPKGSVDNSGQLIADAGVIALQAQVVNQGGLVQANSIRERNGIIELVASEAITLGNNSVISANGDSSSASAGGQIEIESALTFVDAASSQINVTGGGLGGDGGFVEVSALLVSAVHSRIDGHANANSVGGRLLIDPLNITIGNSGSGSIGSGTVGLGDVPVAGTLTLDVNSAFIGFSQITLQALNNITFSAGTLWDLPTSTGLDSVGSLLRLEAGNNITIGNGASILGGQNWSVTLQSGRDFIAADTVKSGVGNIALSGTGAIETGKGDINLLAGNNITVANGFIHTVGGGNITAEAFGGSINTGNNPNAYVFSGSGYELDRTIDPDTQLPKDYTLGGISTAKGGDVKLKAKWDVLSYIPIRGDEQTDAGSGAFGAEAGDVTVEAGRYVAGHFIVRNGTGIIAAGRDAGFAGVPLTDPPTIPPPGEPSFPTGGRRLLDLSVVNGSWTVTAGNNILLKEVRNPNGIFNKSIGAAKHLFDYAPDAFVTLSAVNSVQLLGEPLPRYTDDFEKNILSIYPGRLTITAGAGGVILGNDVVLFPSPTGNLKITTTGNGALGEGSFVSTKAGDVARLIVSDSGKNRYIETTDFGINDHASTPLHLNDSTPVQLDIAGDMIGILLGVPKRAEINIGRDMINSRFDGQNLHATDITSINVGRDIKNDNEYVTVKLDTPPDFSVFALVYPPLPGLAEQFFYDAATKILSYRGILSDTDWAALKDLRVRTFKADGSPNIDETTGEPVTAPAIFVSTSKLDELHDKGLAFLLSADTGYRLGGGGTFNFTARNMDLGATVGIVSQGPRANAALAKYFTRGADINVTLSGDLDMYFTGIASLNGGNIAVRAEQGYVTVGAATSVTADQSARGIFTTDKSDVLVIARDDIKVNGSRVAAYDGGNVFVKSLEGDVDAGTGAAGAATVEKIYVNPVTREVLSYAPTIPGSGILATTFPPAFDPAFPKSVNNVGNITVETPRGDIKASKGGIVQIPLNGVGAKLGTVTLRAGTEHTEIGPDGKEITVVDYVGNIDASGSGVIGSTVVLEASGDIKGLVFARDNLNISANQNVSVIALAAGNASVSAGETISGTIIGVGSVAASGATVDAALLSQNISTSGDASSSQQGFAQGAAASVTSQSLTSDDKAKDAASDKKDESDEPAKKQKPGPRIAKTTGRVTVILPEKKI